MDSHHIEHMRMEYNMYKHINALKYFDILGIYSSLVQDIANFIKEINVNNDNLSYAIILKALTDMGVFSNNGILKYSGDASDAIIGYPGINVITGNICCRHIANFQYNVFDKGNLGNKLFYCFLTNNNLKNSSNIYGNHVINLIYYKNNLYGYDAINNDLFSFIDDSKMSSLFNNKTKYVYYVDYLDRIFGNNFTDVDILKERFEKFKNENVISYDEYLDICNYVKKIIVYNKYDIKSFKCATKEKIKRIIDKL